MKENLETETVDPEKLLREKSWEQLSNAERKVAAEMFADRAEYERMHAMVHQLRSSTGFTEEELVPSDSVRKNLLDAYDDEQRRRRVLWWNSLGFWFRDRLRLDIPAVRFAVAGVILFAGIFAVLRLMNSNGAQPAEFVEQKLPVQDSVPNVVSNDQTNTPVLPVDSFAVEQNTVPVIAPPKEIISPKTVAVRPLAPVPTNKDVAPVDQIDTSASRLAMGTGNDTTVMPIAVNVFSSGDDPVVCCGANIQLTAPISNNATYNWTPSFSLASGTPMNATYVVGQAAPTSRALVEDENLVSVFFSLR